MSVHFFGAVGANTAPQLGYIPIWNGVQWIYAQPLPQFQQRLVASQLIQGGNVTVDFNAGARIFLTLDVNITGSLIVIPPALTTQFCQHVTLLVEQGSGGQTIANYSSNVIWPGGGTPPVLSTGAGNVDILAGIADGFEVTTIRMVPSLGFPT